MALIRCTECGHAISDRASMCPHCGCPTRDEETQHSYDVTPSNTRVITRRKRPSNNWLYGVIALLLSVLAGGGFYWWYSHSKGEDVQQFVDQFAKAVASGDRQTIRNMYPDATDADSLNFSYDEKTLQVIENNENEWKVTGFEGKEIIIAKKDAEKTLYIKESRGVFAYPDSVFTMAKGTGWYDPSLNDKQNAERLSDKGFISWMSQKALKDLKSNIKITKATTVEGPNQSGDCCYSGERICTIVVANLGDRDIAGDEYSIYAQEKWIYREYYDSDFEDGYDYYDTPEKGKAKTLTGKPIPAHETVTYTWKGHSYTYCEMESYENFQLNASVTLLSKGEVSAKNNMSFTGKEYEEYLAERNK